MSCEFQTRKSCFPSLRWGNTVMADLPQDRDVAVYQLSLAGVSRGSQLVPPPLFPLCSSYTPIRMKPLPGNEPSSSSSSLSFGTNKETSTLGSFVPLLHVGFHCQCCSSYSWWLFGSQSLQLTAAAFWGLSHLCISPCNLFSLA